MTVCGVLADPQWLCAMEEEFDIGEIEEEDLSGLKTVGDCVRYLYNKLNG